MIRCIIIDDEPYARDLLKAFVSKVPNLQLEGSFSSALQAMPTIAKQGIDLLFLDIQMPDISGVDFLKSMERKPCVIFTTAFAEYAIEGFELDVIDYLLKPFDFQRFLKAIHKATARIEAPMNVTKSSSAEEEKDFIFVKDGTKLVKVNFNELQFIQGTREYVTLFARGKKIMTLQTMKSFEEQLPEFFFRVHNSFIVNIRYIESVEKDEIQIGDHMIPVGATYKKAFMDVLKKYFPSQ